MVWDEPHRAAFDTAAQATRARIRRDRARAPAGLKKVFTAVSNKLFSTSLTVDEVWRIAGVKDHKAGSIFKEATGFTLGRYITAARIEVASVLMVTTDLDLSAISLRVGYTYHPTFADNFKRLKGKKPSEVARRPPIPPLADDGRALSAIRGVLDPDEMTRHMKELMRICPVSALRIQGQAADRMPRVVVDGARDDELKALGLWQLIRDLPFEEQCQQVRQYLFHSTVLFDLLRSESLVEGRKHRGRGVEIAQLALISLEGADAYFGDRIHELRALGWAWLGNAQRLALDFSAAAAAFEQADREWSQPRAQHDLAVLAHIYGRRGALHTWQREYPQATNDLDRACSLFRRGGDREGEVRALLQRAAIHAYAGKLNQGLQDLHEASDLIDEDEDRELAFAVRADLANIMVRAGQTESAAMELEKARRLCCLRDDPVEASKLDWIAGDLAELQGDLESAVRLYQIVWARLRDAEELRYLGLISVDLMTIHAQQGDWKSVSALAAETVPILSSLNFHSETLATIDRFTLRARAHRHS